MLARHLGLCSGLMQHWTECWGLLCCCLLVECNLGHASAPLAQVSVSTCEGDSHRLPIVQSLFSHCYDRILDKQQLKAGWDGVYFGSQFEGIQSAMVGTLWEQGLMQLVALYLQSESS